LKNHFAQGDSARISDLQMEATTLHQGDLIVTEFFTKLQVVWNEMMDVLGGELKGDLWRMLRMSGDAAERS